MPRPLPHGVIVEVESDQSLLLFDEPGSARSPYSFAPKAVIVDDGDQATALRPEQSRAESSRRRLPVVPKASAPSGSGDTLACSVVEAYGTRNLCASLRPQLRREETEMPKVSRDSATQGGDFGPVVDRSEQLDGYTVNFTSYRENIDATPLMKGLPDDRCQCPHWGYVISGELTLRYADREEVFGAGDAFYTPPGHVPVKNEPGTEVVLFSPAEELRETDAVVMKNMQAMQAG